MNQSIRYNAATPSGIEGIQQYGHLRASQGKSAWLQPVSDKRSVLQNNYLWGWLYKNIAEQLGDAGIVIPLDDGREYPYDTEILHEMFRESFLCKAELTRNGKTRKLYWSTTDLKKHSSDDPTQAPAFGWYVNQIKQFAFQQWEIHIPPTYNEELMMFDAEAAEHG